MARGCDFTAWDCMQVYEKMTLLTWLITSVDSFLMTFWSIQRDALFSPSTGKGTSLQRHSSARPRQVHPPVQNQSLLNPKTQDGKWTCISKCNSKQLKTLCTCHTDPFKNTVIHWWQRLPCKLPACSSGAIGVSLSCPRILGHAARAIWGSNHWPYN